MSFETEIVLQAFAYPLCAAWSSPFASGMSNWNDLTTPFKSNPASQITLCCMNILPLKPL